MGLVKFTKGWFSRQKESKKEMMNREEKPKLTSRELVEKLRDKKGVTFKYEKEETAEVFLRDINNYLRTAAYRKNYQKHLSGSLRGKYIDLDFSYLKDLSTIDMHLRYIIMKMCIDIEHALKVFVLKDLEKDNSENGYLIVDSFLNDNPFIVTKIANNSASPYIGNLVTKYFTVQIVNNNGKNENKITAFDCPVWVLMELLSFGDFIRFYDFYYSIKRNRPIDKSVINLVKSLRNGCAHNNCLIADLNPKKSTPPAVIARWISQMPNIYQNQRKKRLSCRSVLEFVSMLYVYDKVVSGKVKKHRVEELKGLFYGRIKEKKAFYKKNELIISTYDFICRVIENLFE